MYSGTTLPSHVPTTMTQSSGLSTGPCASSGEESELQPWYLVHCRRDALRFSGAYTGTSGTLAAHCMRLLKERDLFVRRVATLSARIKELEAKEEQCLDGSSGKLPSYSEPIDPASGGPGGSDTSDRNHAARPAAESMNSKSITLFLSMLVDLSLHRRED